MDTASSNQRTTTALSSSMIESIRSYGIPGARIDKDDLRRKILMPLYLRLAMRNAIRSRDPNAAFDLPDGDSTVADDADSVADTADADPAGDDTGVVAEEAPEGPMVVFINSRSGGRQGPELKDRLQELMGEEQVFDLSEVKPNDFIEYGLACLEKLATVGDFCAQETRQKLRIVVAGGDGTVGWVLGCVGELNNQGRVPVPPIAIIPLGTGNDLSRSFGWGGSFPYTWKAAIKRTLQKAISGPICRLDSWQVRMSMPSGAIQDPPHSLKPTEECDLDKGLDLTEGQLPLKSTSYEGVFYNYFSIGMDAQVAYGFHQLRNEKPYLAQGPLANKLIYSGYSCSQGWFFTPCMSDPSLRGLKNIVKMHVKKINCPGWERMEVPTSVRAIVCLNLHNYGSGRNPWGTLKREYLEKKGLVEAQADDGLLEIFGLKQGWHASLVMVELISAKHIAQAAAIRFEIRGGEWQDAFMQMDGEPWRQPMSKDYSTFVEIRRVPFQSLMVGVE